MWAGRYRIVDGIAQGAAGWVVRARDEEVDIDVALKLIAPNLLQADDERARFLKLVKTAKKLHHPNIARIYDEGEEGSHVWYTMPFLEGLTLRRIIDLRVERGQNFGFAEVLPLAAQLASAVDGWQRVGPHAALRPHNIVVLPDVLRVTGLPHMRGLPTRPYLALHTQQRTLDYIAPEVRREEELTVTADVFSVATILGEMLVGRLQGNDPTGWIDAASRLPTGIVDVLRRGASDTPSERFESGAALFKALAGAMSNASPELSVPGLPSFPAFASELFDDVSEPSTMDDAPVELVARKPLPHEMSDADDNEKTDTVVVPPFISDKGETKSLGAPVSKPLAASASGSGSKPTSASGASSKAMSATASDAKSGSSSKPMSASASGSKSVSKKPVVAARELSVSVGDGMTPAPGRDPRVPVGRPRGPHAPTTENLHNDTDRIAARPRDRQLKARRERRSSVIAISLMLFVGIVAAAGFRWYGTVKNALARSATPVTAETNTEPETPVTAKTEASPVAPVGGSLVGPAPSTAPVPPAVGLAMGPPPADATTPTAPAPAKPTEAKPVDVKSAEPPSDASTADALRRVATLATPSDSVEADSAPREVPMPPAPPLKALAAPPPPNEDAPSASPAMVTCPAGMVAIRAGKFTSGSASDDPMRAFGDQSAKASDTGSYCVDIYEYPNQRGREPVTGYTWARAKKACESVGKRLCSEEEWERACKGPGGVKFPFGNAYDPGLCNVGEGGRPAPSGEFNRCRSGYGIADMAGNVAEWTSSRWSGDVADRVVKGGAVDQAAFTARCAARAAESSSSHADTLGFRCCADLR